MNTVLRLIVVLPLMACANPREACQVTADRQIASYDALIARTESELRQGYRQREVAQPISYTATCIDAPSTDSDPPRCNYVDVQYRTRREAVDPAEWQSRLDNLRARRPDEVARVQTALAACRARWPE